MASWAVMDRSYAFTLSVGFHGHLCCASLMQMLAEICRVPPTPRVSHKHLRAQRSWSTCLQYTLENTRKPVDVNRTAADTFSGPSGLLAPPLYALSGFRCRLLPRASICTPSLETCFRLPEPLCSHLTLRGWKVPGTLIPL